MTTSSVRTIALVLGIVYVAVGALGFIPGLVTGGPPAHMPSASGSLLGIFPINAVHNVVHLVIGAILIGGSRGIDSAIMAAKGVGIVYLLVGLLGFVAPDTFGLMPIGGADIALHLATAVLLLVLGFMPAEDRGARIGRSPAR